MFKKLSISILLAMAATLMLPAQDIIIKENGDEIRAKVLEIGTGEIRYKKEGNPDGPTYVLLKSDVFLIKYANGTKEVIPLTESAASAQSNTPQQASTQVVTQAQTTLSYSANQSAASTATAKKKKSWKRDIFNLNIIYGNFLPTYLDALEYDDAKFLDYSYMGMAMGYIHNFNPWFGWHFIDVQYWLGPLNFSEAPELRFDFMTGPRVYLASLKRKVTPFISFKAGYSLMIDSNDAFAGDDILGWISIEPELGVNFGRTSYLSFGWKHLFPVVGEQNYFKSGMLFARLGFNF